MLSSHPLAPFCSTNYLRTHVTLNESFPTSQPYRSVSFMRALVQSLCSARHAGRAGTSEGCVSKIPTTRAQLQSILFSRSRPESCGWRWERGLQDYCVLDHFITASGLVKVGSQADCMPRKGTPVNGTKELRIVSCALATSSSYGTLARNCDAARLNLVAIRHVSAS